MKKYLATIALVALVLAGVAGAASRDHGRRLTPPVCIAQFKGASHVVWDGQRLGKVWDGVERSVSHGQKCRPYERSGLGVAVPDKDDGAGKPGAPGKNGKDGIPGQSVTLTSANGCVTIHAANGDGTVCNGANGKDGVSIKGDKGDTGPASTIPGPAGPQGPPGPAGKDGTGGLGNGVIYACVSHGGSLQLDVNGQPCDNAGHLPIKLVVVQ